MSELGRPFFPVGPLSPPGNLRLLFRPFVKLAAKQTNIDFITHWIFHNYAHAMTSQIDHSFSYDMSSNIQNPKKPITSIRTFNVTHFLP